MEVAAEGAAGPPHLEQEAEGELALLLHLLEEVLAGAQCLAQEQALRGVQEPGLERGQRQQEALGLRLGLALGGSPAEHAEAGPEVSHQAKMEVGHQY